MLFFPLTSDPNLIPIYTKPSAKLQFQRQRGFAAQVQDRIRAVEPVRKRDRRRCSLSAESQGLVVGRTPEAHAGAQWIFAMVQTPCIKPGGPYLCVYTYIYMGPFLCLYIPMQIMEYTNNMYIFIYVCISINIPQSSTLQGDSTMAPIRLLARGPPNSWLCLDLHAAPNIGKQWPSGLALTL